MRKEKFEMIWKFFCFCPDGNDPRPARSERSVLAKNLKSAIQRQGLHCVAPALCSRGSKKRIVDGLFGGLDYGEE
jgi:hypothetical protein